MDPYIEESICSGCVVQQGHYFCRDVVCDNNLIHLVNQLFLIQLFLIIEIFSRTHIYIYSIYLLILHAFMFRHVSDTFAAAAGSGNIP